MSASPGASDGLERMRRIERDEVRGFRSLGVAIRGLRAPGAADVVDLGQAVVVVLGADMPVNRAVGFGLEGPEPDGTLDRIEAVFARHAIPCELDVHPLSEPAWIDTLRASGYAPMRRFRVLAGSPADLLEIAASEASARGLEISPARDAEAWVRTCVEGFGPYDDAARAASSAMFARGAFASPDIDCLIATLRGEPVASATLTHFERHGHLGGMSTRPAYRRQGIQRAMVEARIRMTLDAGCDIASVKVTADSDSERNVQRMGFSVAYEKATWGRAEPARDWQR